MPGSVVRFEAALLAGIPQQEQGQLCVQGLFGAEVLEQPSVFGLGRVVRDASEPQERAPGHGGPFDFPHSQVRAVFRGEIAGAVFFNLLPAQGAVAI